MALFRGCPAGDDPLRVVGWRMAEGDGFVKLEVDVRWRGDPNIAFFVEMAAAG